MTSEGSFSSSGSKIRQFGLYRSIDARTEEFLRLSRKRQIRQGCACAAVSTAITVTVVVVVFFVYEFSLNSELNVERSLKTNWYSLINDTNESGFETKYSKSNIDKTTLKLLPILIKALKKNVFLEKILEEQSSSSSSIEERDTTEYSFRKNVFTRNWFQIPSSKLYEITYKTSPIAYYRSPTKNVDYFTKIRKIRDYQRIINYVDKMIGDKVTKPMLKEETSSEKSISKIVLSNKTKTNCNSKPSAISSLGSVDKIIQKNNLICKCPMHFGEFLNIIIQGVERLLSIDIKTKKNIAECHHNKDNQQPHNKDNAQQTTVSFASHDNNLLQKAMSDKSKKLTMVQDKPSNPKNDNDLKTFERSTPTLNDHVDVTDFTQNILTEPINQMNKYRSILKQKSLTNIFKNIYQRFDNDEPSSKSIDENSYYDEYSTTTNYIDILYKKKKLEPVKTEVIHKKRKHNQKSIRNNKPKVKVPISYKTPEISTAKTTTTQYNLWLDLKKAMNRLIEKTVNIQIKPKSIETTTRVLITKTIASKPTTITNIATKLTTPKSKGKNLSALIEENAKNVTKVARFLQNETTKFKSNILGIFKEILQNQTNLMNMEISKEEDKEDLFNATGESLSVLIKEKTKNLTKVAAIRLLKNETRMDRNNVSAVFQDKYENQTYPEKTETRHSREEDIEYLSNVTEDDRIKQIQSIINSPSKPIDSVTYKTDELWEELNNENVPAWKSMMPNQSPIYLEIQKNSEWKHEKQDYDFNILNNYDIEI